MAKKLLNSFETDYELFQENVLLTDNELRLLRKKRTHFLTTLTRSSVTMDVRDLFLHWLRFEDKFIKRMDRKMSFNPSLRTKIMRKLHGRLVDCILFALAQKSIYNDFNLWNVALSTTRKCGGGDRICGLLQRALPNELETFLLISRYYLRVDKSAMARAFIFKAMNSNVRKDSYCELIKQIHDVSQKIHEEKKEAQPFKPIVVVETFRFLCADPSESRRGLDFKRKMNEALTEYVEYMKKRKLDVDVIKTTENQLMEIRREIGV